MTLPPFPRGAFLLSAALIVSMTATAEAQFETTAASDEDVLETPETDDDVDRGSTYDEDGRLSKIKTQSASIGYRGLVIQTDGAGRHVYHGPSVAYDYFVGRELGFAMHAEASFPAFGYYKGQFNFSGPLYGTYEAGHFALDGSMMIAYRAELSDKLSFISGLGVHVQWFKLNSDIYSAVEVISMGLGMSSRLQWRFHPMFSLDSGLVLAFDPFDMIDHDNPSTLVLPFGATIGVGVRY